MRLARVAVLLLALPMACATHEQRVARADFRRGGEAVAKGFELDALKYYERALKADPENVSYKNAVVMTRRAVVSKMLPRVDELETPLGRVHFLVKIREYDDDGRVQPRLAQEIATIAAAELESFALADAAIQKNDLTPASTLLAQSAEKIAELEKLSGLPALTDDQKARRDAVRKALEEKLKERVTRLEEVAALAHAGGQAPLELACRRASARIAKEVGETAAPISPELVSSVRRSVFEGFQVRISESTPATMRSQLQTRVADTLRAIGIERDAFAESNGVDVSVELVDFRWDIDPADIQRLKSRYLRGYREVSNPAYQRALRDYQQALAELSSAPEKQRIVAKVTAEHKKKKLDAIPEKLREPVYEPYEYMKATIVEAGRLEFRVVACDEESRSCADERAVVKSHDARFPQTLRVHQNDSEGVKEERYSFMEAATRQVEFEGAALDAAQAAILTTAADALRARAKTLAAEGLAREAIDATARAYEFDEAAAFDGRREEAEKYLLAIAELPAAAKPEAWKKIRAKKLALGVDLAAPKSKRVRSTKKLTTSEVARCGGPAVVSVRSSGGSGSGFFVDEAGWLLTNHHVVDDDRQVTVVTADGKSYSATVVRTEPRRDIAVLRIPTGTFPYVALSARPPAPGDTVVAIGAPQGLAQSVTKGIVSALRRGADVFQDALSQDGSMSVVQTDVALNPGNSGGPLLDEYCEVVGMNTFGLRDSQGLNFAVGTETLEKAMATARTKRP